MFEQLFGRRPFGYSVTLHSILAFADSRLISSFMLAKLDSFLLMT
jgi:hypothetical protein